MSEGQSRHDHSGEEAPLTRAAIRQREAQQSSSPTLPPAKPPVSSAVLTTVGVVMATAVTAAGVAAVRDALVYADVIDGTPLLSSAARAVNGVDAAAWMVPVAILLAAVGLWLVVLAIKPRTRTTRALTANTGVFVGVNDIGRLATATALDIDGVTGVTASTKSRNVVLHVETTGDAATADLVESAVTRRLNALEKPPTVHVRTRRPTP